MDQFKFYITKITSRLIVTGCIVVLAIESLTFVGNPNHRLAECKISTTRSKIISSRNVDRFVDEFLENDSQNIRKFKKILNGILVPRSVNTTGHRQVRKFIKTSLSDLGSNWFVDEDSFSNSTPIGEIRFRNIVATYMPKDWPCSISLNETRPPKRIVLACHYDTLHPSMISSIKQPNPFFAHFGSNLTEFTGAIDAAVSCSMMIYLAQFITPILHKHWSNPSKQPYTLQLVFFDGEEALVTNSRINSKMRQLVSTRSNSLYGSRHLATKWSHNTIQSSKSDINNHNEDNDETETNRIDDTNTVVRKKMQTNRLLKISHRNTKRFGRLLSQCSKSNRLSLLNAKNAAATSPNEILAAVPVKKHKKTKRNKRKHHHNKGKNNNKLEWASESKLSPTAELSRVMHSLHRNYYNLENIDLFLLMDLIGGSSPRFFNTNLSTVNHFRLLALIERNVIKSLNVNGHSLKPYFQTKPSFLLSLVRDDHLPFVVHNVSILHLIPHPFPRVWHRMEDNFENINFDTVRRLILILELFLLNALNVN